MIPSGLGVALPWQIEYLVSPALLKARLAPAWYYNYLANHLEDSRYIPMLWRPTPGSAEWNNAIADMRATGRFYLAFNEPERADQANVPAEEAAAISRLIIAQARKNNKPVAWCGLNVAVSPGSMTYLTNYKAAGGVKPPYWGIHIYANGPQHWNDLFQLFSSWCQIHGWVSPIIVTETGAANLNPAIQDTVLRHAVARMGNTQSLVAVGHFSALYGPENSYWSNSDLFQWSRPFLPANENVAVTGSLTPLGNTFQELSVGNKTYLPLVRR